MDIEGRIKAFVSLGKLLQKTEIPTTLLLAIEESIKQNLWFNKENILYALSSIADNLQPHNLYQWLSMYNNKELFHKPPQKVAVIMAGNIPLVGFHDFLCVLMSGNRILVKLSSDDRFLLPAIAELLVEIEPSFEDYIVFTTQKVSNFDAVIATGSDNTSRYFDYYFGKYPHIIRKNRNSITILEGSETTEELSSLSDDIFLYFGLGCRNVSKLFVPKGFNFTDFINAMQKYSHLGEFSKFKNNYDYRKTICLMNNINFIDGGFFIMQENSAFSSPLSVLHFEYYKDIENMKEQLKLNSNKLQCVVAKSAFTNNVPFGKSQRPQLWDYADNLDTLSFLLSREKWKMKNV